MDDISLEEPLTDYSDTIGDLIRKSKYDRYRNQFLVLGGIIMFLQFLILGLLGGGTMYVLGQYNDIKGEGVGLVREIQHDLQLVEPFIGNVYSFINETKKDMAYFEKYFFHKRSVKNDLNLYIKDIDKPCLDEHDAYTSPSSSTVPYDYERRRDYFQVGTMRPELFNLPTSTTESDPEFP